MDEPFYAAWLVASGEVHPMQEEILASQPADPAIVAQDMLAPLPPGKTLHYQKHMTHHMLDRFVITSYSIHYTKLYEECRRYGLGEPDQCGPDGVEKRSQ